MNLGLESLYELWSTVRHNKLRTVLTALSVAWGIFMLVVLLAVGSGLENGALYEFRDDVVNSLWVSSDKTSVPFAGRGPGRDIRFTNADYNSLRDDLAGAEYVAGQLNVRGISSVRHAARRAEFEVIGTHPEQRHLQKTVVLEGRFLNPVDVAERRKVAVIGSKGATLLFGEERSAIGSYIDIRGSLYRVVGVVKQLDREAELGRIYIPISSAQFASDHHERVDKLLIKLTSQDVDDSERLADGVRALLAERHAFDVADPQAVSIENNLEQFEKISRMFRFIHGFIWIVGLGTLLAGIVGVSNIILISVAERTREIGIRKALGATPSTIVRQILLEALLITGIAGYAGLLSGVLIIELFAQYASEVPFMRQPRVDFQIAASASVLILITAGLAGFFPARRAASVNPIVALRDA
jgi:putative ABC transport system permease protein